MDITIEIMRTSSGEYDIFSNFCPDVLYHADTAQAACEAAACIRKSAVDAGKFLLGTFGRLGNGRRVAVPPKVLNAIAMGKLLPLSHRWDLVPYSQSDAGRMWVVAICGGGLYPILNGAGKQDEYAEELNQLLLEWGSKLQENLSDPKALARLNCMSQK